MYFQYGSRETEYLKSRDKALGEVIDRIGPVFRETDPNLFSSVVHHIVGQQISTKAQATIWARMKEQLGEVTPATIAAAPAARLQSAGISFRKVEYIRDFAAKVQSGALDLQEISRLPDDQAIKALASLKGIGVWTAEMILLFCALTTWPSSGGSEWSTITEVSTGNGLRSTADGSAPAAVLPACISGPWPEALSRR